MRYYALDTFNHLHAFGRIEEYWEKRKFRIKKPTMKFLLGSAMLMNRSFQCVSRRCEHVRHEIVAVSTHQQKRKYKNFGHQHQYTPGFTKFMHVFIFTGIVICSLNWESWVDHEIKWKRRVFTSNECSSVCSFSLGFEIYEESSLLPKGPKAVPTDPQAVPTEPQTVPTVNIETTK